MKNNFRNYFVIFIFLLSGVLSSCDKDFKNINTSVDFVSKPNLDYELPYIELTMEDKNYYTISRNVAAFVGQIYDNYTFQRLITPDEDYMGEHFKWMYQNPLKTVEDYMGYAQADPNKVNYLSIGRILRVNCFDLLTDSYGDVPYFEANKGYTDQIIKPKYDPQQKIYEDMFKELTEAVAAFDESKPVPSLSDIVYKGDISKWKKFANSLMFRLALRVYNVDPSNGKKYIDQAIAGGLVESNADNFIVTHQSNSSNTTTANGIMKVFISSSYVDRWRLASPFIDSLKNRNDPRTTVYAMRPTAPFTSFHDGDHTFDNQRGFPQFGGVTETRNNFSTCNYLTYARYDAPTIWLSYAEVQFNLAECVVRGIISGDAKTYYENGVRAAMDELSVFGPDAIVTSQQADDYLLANPYDPSNALVMINTQYWIETFANWYECWANMRRTGIPDTYSSLDQSIEANFGATLPRRLTYPGSEIIANPHVQDAVANQGPDEALTRLWWDKP
jgi:hypothetical protein